MNKNDFLRAGIAMLATPTLPDVVPVSVCKEVKITDIRAYVFNNAAFVKIETDAGVSGWGEGAMSSAHQWQNCRRNTQNPATWARPVRFRAVRKAVGDSVDIFVDFNNGYTTKRANAGESKGKVQAESLTGQRPTRYKAIPITPASALARRCYGQSNSTELLPLQFG